ncbi:hypothetical protein U8D42_18200 [Mycobacterium europaeum]|uniref:hypothetical protein n=1 Tax=Mycobacterium europaeum TaxID=761804 RepID=UPI0020123F6B|nr:hypothetical protein [Mycobacterium europaeum]MEA1158715.1 hypothetical protein [Mycobacterium europaeum]
MAILLGAGVEFAPVAGSDPNPFSNLSCHCQSPPGVSSDVRGQIARGIDDGLSRLHAREGG